MLSRQKPENSNQRRISLKGGIAGLTLFLGIQALSLRAAAQDLSLTSDSHCRRAVTSAYLVKRVNDLPLSGREVQVLRRSHIYTVRGLLKNTAVDLLRLPGLGDKQIQKIEGILADFNLSLPRHPLTAVGISLKIADTLDGLGIRSLEELISKTEYDLQRLYGLGYKTITEVKTALKESGLSLSVDPFTDLGFSFWDADLFYRAGLHSPAALTDKTEIELWRLPQFQRLPLQTAAKVIKKIKRTLRPRGLSLAQDPLMSLGLPFETALRLQRAGIRSSRDLRQKTEADLLRIPRIGKKSVQKIREVLVASGGSLAPHSEGDSETF